MGDAFPVVRYTLPLIQRGKNSFRCSSQPDPSFRDHLAWKLTEVVDRRSEITSTAVPKSR